MNGTQACGDQGHRLLAAADARRPEPVDPKGDDMTVSVLATVEEARSLLNDAVEKVILGDACHALVATPTRDWSGTSEARRAIRELFELADYLNQLARCTRRTSSPGVRRGWMPRTRCMRLTRLPLPNSWRLRIPPVPDGPFDRADRMAGPDARGRR